MNLETDWVLDEEPMGSKAKKWLQLPGSHERWLFKYPRMHGAIQSGEHWAEKIAAEQAALLGVPHATVELARFDGTIGSASLRFPELDEDGVELVHGNDVLAGLLLDYDPSKRRFEQTEHTLENVLDAVERLIPDQPGREEAIVQLGGYVLLDALILNTDRHNENWGLFKRTTPGTAERHWVAPTFDHASSLGRELVEPRLSRMIAAPDGVARYAAKGRGGVFLRGQTAVSPLDLCAVAQRLRPEAIAPWTHRLAQIGLPAVLAVVDKVPNELMSGPAKTFARNVLTYTYGKLV